MRDTLGGERPVALVVHRSKSGRALKVGVVYKWVWLNVDDREWTVVACED